MKFKKIDRFKEGSVNEERNGVRHSQSFSFFQLFPLFPGHP